MTFLWTLLWNFHFFFNWPLDFPCSSIPLKIPWFKHIQNGKYWEITFLLQFSGQEIHEKSTKNKGFQCLVTQVVMIKNSWNKSKYKFNFYFTFEIINIHNRSCRKLFFLPLLNPLFHYSNLLKVFNWPCTSQKTVCSRQNSFFLQNKGSNNPIWVGRHTKKTI